VAAIVSPTAPLARRLAIALPCLYSGAKSSGTQQSNFSGWPSLENILCELKTVLPRDDFVIEGPFGGHTGYYTLPEGMQNAVTITQMVDLITFRLLPSWHIQMKTIVVVLTCSFWFVFQLQASSVEGWTTVAPREEIRPQFQYEETGGKSGHGAFTIRADEREGLHGWWQKIFSVTGGQHYRFSAWRRAESVAVPRRSVLARVVWTDDTGKSVPRPVPPSLPIMHSGHTWSTVLDRS